MNILLVSQVTLTVHNTLTVLKGGGLKITWGKFGGHEKVHFTICIIR